MAGGSGRPEPHRAPSPSLRKKRMEPSHHTAAAAHAADSCSSSETARNPISSGSGAAGRTRTPNLLIRSQTLYPIELRAHTEPWLGGSGGDNGS